MLTAQALARNSLASFYCYTSDLHWGKNNNSHVEATSLSIVIITHKIPTPKNGGTAQNAFARLS